jgi:hypothetical protein
VLVERATHDGSYGRTRVIVETDTHPDQQVIHELTGCYQILAYSVSADSFVLGGTFETGVFMFMDVLLQVDARDGSLRRSRYKLPLHAVSAVASTDGEHLALLGAPGWHDSAPRLWIYRPALDALYGPLGAAPAPPPSSFACDHPKPSRWLDLMGEEGYQTLEPGIVSFPASNRLRVSYGADTCRARAQRRRIQEWDLSLLKKVWMPADKDNQPPE